MLVFKVFDIYAIIYIRNIVIGIIKLLNQKFYYCYS